MQSTHVISTITSPISRFPAEAPGRHAATVVGSQLLGPKYHGPAECSLDLPGLMVVCGTQFDGDFHGVKNI